MLCVHMYDGQFMPIRKDLPELSILWHLCPHVLSPTMFFVIWYAGEVYHA